MKRMGVGEGMKGNRSKEKLKVANGRKEEGEIDERESRRGN